MVNYTMFGTTLDAGPWSDWFAGAGSFAAVGAAFFGYWTVHRTRVKAEQLKERQLAEAVQWKLLQIYNEIAVVAQHIKESLSADFDPEYKPYQFLRVRPLGIPPKTSSELNSDEVSFLIRANGSSILMDIADLFARHESIKFTMDEYRVRYDKLFELLPTPKKIQGMVASHIIDADDMKEILPRALFLDNMLKSLIDLLIVGVTNGNKLLDDFAPLMEAYFGTKWHVVLQTQHELADLTIFQSVDTSNHPSP